FALVNSVVALKSPDRYQHLCRHTISVFNPFEYGPISLEHVRSFAEAIGRYHAPGKLLKALLKHALRMVARDNAGVVSDTVQCGSDRPLGNACPHRFLFEVVEPVRKIFPLALRGARDAG